MIKINFASAACAYILLKAIEISNCKRNLVGEKKEMRKVTT